jgi:hypothetical protein
MIWPFPSRGARVDTALPDVDDMPPLEAFLVNDAVIKVWLPAKLSGRADWLSAHHGSSRPDVLRALLFEHVYGRVAMRKLEMFARKRWGRASRHSRRSGCFSSARRLGVSTRRAPPLKPGEVRRSSVLPDFPWALPQAALSSSHPVSPPRTAWDARCPTSQRTKSRSSAAKASERRASLGEWVTK